jgi:hypothetical protein
MPWFEEGKRRNGASRGAVSTLHDFVLSIFGYAARCVPPGFVIRGWTFLFSVKEDRYPRCGKEDFHDICWMAYLQPTRQIGKKTKILGCTESHDTFYLQTHIVESMVST